MIAMKKGANAPPDAAETASSSAPSVAGGFPAGENSAPEAALPLRVPVTLLSPLTPSKKGANALYIGVLSPLHP